MDDERIIIDFDNDEEENATANDSAQSGNQIGTLDDTWESNIVITLDDLKGVENSPIKNTYHKPHNLQTSYYEKKSFEDYKTNPFIGFLSGINDIMLALILGALGGLVSFLVNEPFYSNKGVEVVGLVNLIKKASMTFMCTGAFIGMFLGSLEGIRQGSLYRIGMGAVKGLGAGVVGGILAGVFGQLIYSLIIIGSGGNPILEILARTIGWGFVGAFIGVSQGIAKKLDKRVQYGFIGGLCGGVIGGFLFDGIAVLFTDTASRLVGDVFVGAAIGVAIYMVENIAKQAWIRIMNGPLKGKEFILFSKTTTFGNSPKCDILVKDADAMPIHGRIDFLGANKYVVSLIDPAGELFVNNMPTNRTFIKNGDIIRVGDTNLLFELKTNNKTPYR